MFLVALWLFDYWLAAAEAWTAIFRRNMRSGWLVVWFAVLLLVNLLSAEYPVSVCSLVIRVVLVIRYLSTLSYSRFCGPVWKLEWRTYPYFSPPVIIDVETYVNRCHSRTDTSMWFTLDLHHWERSSAPRGRCWKASSLGVGGSVFFNYN